MFDLKSIFERINRYMVDKGCVTGTVRAAIRQELNGFIVFHVNIIASVNFSVDFLVWIYLPIPLSHFIFNFSIRSVIEDFRDLMSGTIFVTFAISVTWLCTSLFQIHAVRGNILFD